jgi:hypothetical protein
MEEKKEEEIQIIDKRRVNRDVEPTKEERDRIIDILSKRRKDG